jgi:hypothetical integral membrane protein (TIGR02206 family)
VGALTWTWDYFFVPQNQSTPDGTGFGMLSAIHLGVLGLLAIGITALVLVYRQADAARRVRIRLAVGWTVLLLEVLRQLAYLVTRTYTPDIAPLHLCAFATFAVFVDAVRPNRWTGDFLYALGWWGALAADVFPDWADRPILNIFTWQSFAIHALILGYVAMRLVAGELVPDVRNLWRVAVIAAVGATLGAVANRAWGTNFWFLNAGSPGSPLEPIHTFAGAFYIPVLVVAVALVWALLYLPWVLRGRRTAVSRTSR